MEMEVKTAHRLRIKALRAGIRWGMYAVIASVLVSCSRRVDRVNVSGLWDFSMDSIKWIRNIELPGSMASNNLGDDISVSTEWTGGIVDSAFFFSHAYEKYRKTNNVKVPFWLQPVKYYKGKAWYRKEIVIPSDWEGNDISLYLERCHWESRLWVASMILCS